MEPFLKFRPADIVLTCSHGFAAKGNRIGQLILTGKSAQFTHVAICLAPDVLLDARPFEHVQLRNIFDEVRSGGLAALSKADSAMLVLRNTALSASHETMDVTMGELTRPLYPQLRKKYNWLFLRRQVSDTNPVAAEAQRAFCSELCVLMLQYLTVLPDRLRASKTLPVHIQNLLSCGWSDVTEEWSAELQSVRQAIDAPASEHGRIVMQREKMANLWINETEGWASIQESLATLVNNVSRGLDDLVGRTKQQL